MEQVPEPLASDPTSKRKTNPSKDDGSTTRPDNPTKKTRTARSGTQRKEENVEWPEHFHDVSSTEDYHAIIVECSKAIQGEVWYFCE